MIRSGREERVIIALGEGRFEARQVLAGIESGNYVEIIKGVKAGESIVTSGQFLIDSEASMRGSLTRMTDESESKREMTEGVSSGDAPGDEEQSDEENRQ